MTASWKELTAEEQKRYGAVYCGICREIRQRSTGIGRICLSYDMAFLALLLMSLYEPEEEKPRTRSAGLMPVVYESEPNSNYSNADIIRPDECMKGYLATFYDTDCFKIEASNLSDARGYTVQLAVPPGVDYDIRIYDQSNN